MLFWWVTLISSVEPLANVANRALYSVAFYFADNNNNNNNNNHNDSLLIDHNNNTLNQQVFASNNLTVESVMANKSWVFGTYSYESSTNFNEYLKELGVNYMLRTFAGLASPVVTISKKCPNQKSSSPPICDWTIRTDTMFKSHELNFRLDEWGDDVTMDGRAVRFKVSRTGLNTLQETQEGGGKTTSLLRRFSSDRMEVKLSVNHVEAVSVFKREFANEELAEKDLFDF